MPANEYMNQSIYQSINQSINQLFKQSNILYDSDSSSAI